VGREPADLKDVRLQPSSSDKRSQASSPEFSANRRLLLMVKKPRSTRPLLGAAKVAIRICSAVILILLLLKRTDVRHAFELIREARVGLLAAGVLVMAAPLAIGGFRWLLLLRAQGLRLPYHFVLRVNIAGYALSTVLPTSVGGDLLRVGYTTRGGMVEAALATVLSDRILGVGGLLIICDLASLLLLARTGSPGLVALAGPATAVISVFLLALMFEPTYSGLARLAGRVRFLRLGERLVRVADGVRQYRTQPRLVLKTLALSVLLWLVYSLVWFLLGSSVRSPASVLSYLVCVPLVSLSAMLPVSIGGLGVRENGFVILMGRFGMPEASAAAVALLFLGATALYALVGALLFATLRGERHRLAEPAVRLAVGSARPATGQC